jgi:hypothetical protein
VADEKLDPLDPDPAHFMTCPECGGTIDMSNLVSVVWHQTHEGEQPMQVIPGVRADEEKKSHG